MLWLDRLKYNLDTNKTQLTIERNIQVWWSISAGSCRPRPCAAAWCPEGGWRSGERSWTPACRSVFASWTGSSTAGPSCRSGMFPGSGSTGPRDKRTDRQTDRSKCERCSAHLRPVLFVQCPPTFWCSPMALKPGDFMWCPQQPSQSWDSAKKAKTREDRDQSFNNNNKRETKLLKLNAKNSWGIKKNSHWLSSPSKWTLPFLNKNGYK